MTDKLLWALCIITYCLALYISQINPPSPRVERGLGGEVYTCTADTYNCADFPTQSAAQSCYNECYPNAGDIHQLDRDNDGLACESLP